MNLLQVGIESALGDDPAPFEAMHQIRAIEAIDLVLQFFFRNPNKFAGLSSQIVLGIV